MQLSTRSAIARSTQAYCSLISEAESLTHGVTFRCERFRQLTAANQIREVVADSAESAAQAFDAVEAYYESHGLQCHRWAPTIDADPEVLNACLSPHGFTTKRLNAMVLADWPTLNENSHVRILPARPMRDAFRATYVDASLAGPDNPNQVADAALDRLDEAAMDMFVAVVDKKPVGRGGLFTVGDIGLIVDVAVLPEWRGQGVGTSVMRHLLALAQRLIPRIVCLDVDADDEALGALLTRCGFVADGQLIEFDRVIQNPKTS
ncbi:MAG: GNAT family N-acetyltransferase [Planctomycetes bacterium]|nr:GNAT family N-acetyltransferase [Planctomycetota bacterium]